MKSQGDIRNSITALRQTILRVEMELEAPKALADRGVDARTLREQLADLRGQWKALHWVLNER